MSNESMLKDFQKLIVHLKTTGFIFPNSEIYGGFANAWDYGPLGVEFKRNLKALWWKEFVTKEPNNLGFDAAILMNPKIWQASGHIDEFSDPLVDCKKCKRRFRADKLKENYLKKHKEHLDAHLSNIPCPFCKSIAWTDIRNFNLMFSTNANITDDGDENIIYLRPETAQGIFVQFLNIARSQRKKLPFGVGQIGKAFRNEITPGNFIFRTKEFEQMELEFFFIEEFEKHWNYYLKKIDTFLIQFLNLKPEDIKKVEHPKNKLAHYSKKTLDFEYKFPFGFEELWGIAHRGNFDLNLHQDKSKTSLMLQENKTKILPEIIEPSVGVERLMLAVLWNSFTIESLKDNGTRILLKLPTKLAPYYVCVLPLSKKQQQEAIKVYQMLLDNDIKATYDLTGSIGKRYRRQDAIGTPFCVTIDFDTNQNNKVSVRDRDSMNQKFLEIKNLVSFLSLSTN